MGIYNYTFKKASRNITDEGVKTIVQHLSYAYKSSCAWSAWGNNNYQNYCNLRDSQAERSFVSYDGGYIVVHDVKDDNGKLSNLDKLKVYKNLKKSYWLDCDNIEEIAEYVGYLVKKGRSYELVHAVTNYEDASNKVVAELHVKDADNSKYVRYHFTDKQTGKTISHYIHKKVSLESVTKHNNIAKAIFGMVV